MFEFVKRTFFKLILGPMKYRQKNGYDAEGYWKDRFLKHGKSLRGVGNEGFTEEENKKMYQRAGDVFRALCGERKINFSKINILEIGCGTGFFTDIVKDLGATKYTGIDITDVFFPTLKEAYPTFQFIQRDVTCEPIDGKYDLILMIDVIEHIVNDKKLSYALNNILNSLSPTGTFILSGVMEKSKTHLFYSRCWSVADIEKKMENIKISTPIPFKKSSILVIER